MRAEPEGDYDRDNDTILENDRKRRLLTSRQRANQLKGCLNQLP